MPDTTPPTAPLDGVKVLDLARVLAGPLCAAMLGDLGATVTKVELPGHGDDSRHFTPHQNGESTYFMLLNRGKRSITIDLKSEQGHALLLTLIEQADVLVENFRPGVTARLGIDWETVKAINPRLVYVSISGFGQTGPLSKRAAYDHIVQAMGGIMSVTGWADGPPTRIGDAVGDVVAGIYGSWGALAALLQRASTGAGQHVDVAMLDSIFSLQMVSLSQLLGGGPLPGRIGNSHPISAPMDGYAAADGHVVIAVANDPLFARLTSVLGQPELVTDPRFASDPARMAHQDDLRAVIESWASTRPVDTVVAELEHAGVPAAPIWDIAQVAASEHAAHRGLVQSVRHPVAGMVDVVPQPVHFSGAARTTDLAAPTLGQHTDEILAHDLGLTAREIADLHAGGVV
ncbi:CaiB/BaiF CoA transferase family protein [Rathayibacter tanaceti]|uniref:CoA transferase n=2 Tax=Rathayibacter tanaceti TaxID=1671680 RepID=A0A162J3B8_9MICO|nr:CoA transferase [Rathayibacter tanaceti]KZX21577.1 Formyl-coenzyme A transferase [Rathayibacter tanaceti]QHC56632.1 CoA transferase [Rathayibacter tanaceti]TCO36223.1 crotonobetainyl-CoA:carnitine CoA-transferase CaiB-like acyl-CoA transferase [Rathayibacter tanaceti]